MTHWLLNVFGQASQKIVASLPIHEEQLEMTLMDFLRSNGIPVASSCLGEGVCRKCVVNAGNKEILSCLIPLKTFLAQNNPQISISYL